MEKLLEYFNAERGRRIALAKHLKTSPANVSMWKEVPPHRVRAIAEFTGIPPEHLRPDLAEIFSGTVVPNGRTAADAPGARA